MNNIVNDIYINFDCLFTKKKKKKKPVQYFNIYIYYIPVMLFYVLVFRNMIFKPTTVFLILQLIPSFPVILFL